jgi:hypothetical protein
MRSTTPEKRLKNSVSAQIRAEEAAHCPPTVCPHIRPSRRCKANRTFRIPPATHGRLHHHHRRRPTPIERHLLRAGIIDHRSTANALTRTPRRRPVFRWRITRRTRGPIIMATATAMRRPAAGAIGLRRLPSAAQQRTKGQYPDQQEWSATTHNLNSTQPPAKDQPRLIPRGCTSGLPLTWRRRRTRN